MITFDSIAKNLHSYRVETTEHGSSLRCIFVCPQSGLRLLAEAPILEIDRDLNSGSPEHALTQGGVLLGVRDAVILTLRRILGYAETQGPSPSQGATTPEDTQKPEDRALQAAAVRAFLTLVWRFRFDETRGYYVARNGDSYELQGIMEQPPETAHDRTVFARMLAEIAQADGSISEPERLLLDAFLAPDLNANQVAPLTPADLQQTSEGVRRTCLLLSLAVALADTQLTEEEKEVLGRHARGLGIADDEAAKLKHLAKLFVLSAYARRARAESGSSAEAEAEVRAVSTRLGLDEAEALSLASRSW